MKRADDGYATILVTVLMGSLSLVAMAWLNLSSADFNKALPCLREALTVFHDAAPPTRRSGDESLRDGSLVRIRVETGSSLASRGLDATVLLTGDRSNPAWIMDWRRYSDFDAEACDNDN